MAVPIIRDAVRSVDADQPTFDERTLDDVRQETFARSRELAWLIGGFAALALLLSAIGVYGVMASLTVARRREMAIRLALGASQVEVMRLVVGDALRLASLAVVVGIAATPVAMTLAAQRIAGLDGWHPGTTIAVAALLACICACAATIPAYRAARVGELVALRE
jgi:ABC-type antimicrobial peptide transport system permease subunit